MSEHTDELKRALVAIRDLRRQVRQLESGVREPIAIIGAACRFPGGAHSPEAFWELLRTRTDATSEVPSDRWINDEYYDPDPEAAGKLYTRRAGFLTEPLDRFDAAFFGISPREASSLDPLQRIMLELSWEALERAGIPPLSLQESSTGVFVGAGASEFNTLQQGLVSLKDIDSYRGTGAAASIISGRISYFLGLQGPNLTIDTACSSALNAIVLAVESLRAGACEMALAGSAHLMLDPAVVVYLCRLRALSPTGRSLSFDAAADGYGRGEGGAMFVLKRLSQALADRDPVMAVIRGAAANHDGRSGGLTVPNPAAQRAVIQAAVRNAELEPSDVGYVEAHGTGTPLGDPIEVRALAEALGQGRTAGNPLLIGSVKTNIGHLEAASGAAGLLKVVLSLQHGELPPQLKLTAPTPHVDWERLPVRITQEPWSWKSNEREPFAGVSSYGLSGTNAHVIVGRAPEPSASVRQHPAELILLSAQTTEALHSLAGDYAAVLDAPDAPSLADLALTSVVGRSWFSRRAFVAASSEEEMRDGLLKVVDGEGKAELTSNSAAGGPGRIAFLFTGQGSQYPRMAHELVAASPLARETLQRCDLILRPHLDRPLLELLLEEEDRLVIEQTRYAQPALFAVEYTLATLWRNWGVEPSYLLGHSLGEYVAATIAGVMSLEEALPLVALRGRLMQELPSGGAMAAVLAPEGIVRAVLGAAGAVEIAALNGPDNVVISGDAREVEAVMAQLATKGVESKRLHVSHAFHSSQMDPMLGAFEAAVASVQLSPPTIPLISNLTGRPLTAEEAVNPARWRRHVREPVRFGDSIVELHRLGVQTFLEVGPHPALTPMGIASIVDAKVRWLPSMRRGRSAWWQMLETLGDLWLTGLDLDTRAFSRDHGGRRVVAPTYRFQRERYWFTDSRPSGAIAAPKPPTGGDRVLHSMLGRLLDSPAIEGWVFETKLSSAIVPFLGDRRIGGRSEVPLGCFVEMLLQSARFGPGWSKAEIRGLIVDATLPLDETSGSLCQVILSPPAGGWLQARVVARTASDEGWTTIATAVLANATEASDKDRDRIFPRVPGEPIDVRDLYESLATRGIEYGSALRTLAEGSCRDGEGIGTAELAAEMVGGEFLLHPGFLEAAHLLLVRAGAPEGDPTLSWLPSRMDYLNVVQPLGAKCSMRVALLDGEKVGELTGDIQFLDDNGELLAEVRGYHLESTRAPLAETNQYHVAWTEAAIDEASVSLEGKWLLVGDDPTMVATVEMSLQSLGVKSVHTLKSATESRDVHAYSADIVVLIDSAGPLSPMNARSGFSALLDVLASDLLSAGARLVIVTRGASGPGGPAGDHWLSGAALWGAIGAVRAERPELDARIVDLPISGATSGAIALALMGVDGSEDRVVVRDDRLLLPRLVRGREFERRSQTPKPIAADASYVITGGRGGVGKAVAAWLVEQGAGAVILNGRSEPDASTQAWMADLRAAGSIVEWCSGDVADSGAAGALVDAAAATGRPLRGIFHAAGLLDDGMLATYSAQRFDRVAAPKISGALNLHEATRHGELDHFVLFSSIAAVLAGPGQAAYASANSALAAIGEWRREAGLPAVTLDWGAWAGEGMAARLNEREWALMEARGLEAMHPAEAVAGLELALSAGVGRGVIARIRWERAREAAGVTPPPFLRDLIEAAPTVAATVNSGTVQRAVDLSDLMLSSTDERLERLNEYVVTALAAVLRLKPERIVRDDAIAAYGFDSLMAMELRNRIEMDLGVIVPVATLLSNVTAGDLAHSLLAMIAIPSDFARAAEAADNWIGGGAARPIESFDF